MVPPSRSLYCWETGSTVISSMPKRMLSWITFSNQWASSPVKRDGYFLSGLGLGIHVQSMGFKVSAVAEGLCCREDHQKSKSAYP